MKPREPAPHPDPRARADALGIPWIEDVPDDWFDPGLLGAVPVEWARANRLLPLRVAGAVAVLTADPDAIVRRTDLTLLLGCEPRPYAASVAGVANAIERCYARRPASAVAASGLPAGAPGPAATPAPASGEDLLVVSDQAPVTRFVNGMLLEAVRLGASDIHVEPFERHLRLRFRIDGVLYEQASPPRAMEDALVSRLKVMARMDIAERRLPQDGMARVRVGERELDVRVSTVPVAEGERVVLRILDRASALLPLERLGMAPVVREPFEGLLAHPHGMLVVSGPTGSGKTTTLYAALARLDAARRNVMTVEDPIEYQLPDIGQIQVKPKIGLTFALGLRHILRQDPDVILVGETRDLETAEIAIRASLTGHLVLTTLHTNDAPGAVVRLLDMGIEPFLLASCLRGVLAQRLVRRLCPACRRPAPADAAALRRLGWEGGGAPVHGVWTATGCTECLEGYRGRVGLFELMRCEADIPERIRQGGADVEALRAAAVRCGMTSLRADALAKVRDGLTSVQEALAVVSA